MAPRVPALAQSESKIRFFERLGLDPANHVHKRVYALMKAEAAEGRRRLLRSQDTSTAQIYEGAWRREATRIYDEARAETKAVYQFGDDPEESDNWIIRWLLWHVFRYRDYRNKPRILDESTTVTPTPESSSNEDDGQPASVATTPGAESSTDSVGAGSSSAAVSDTQVAEPASASRWYWDPVRERWLDSHS